MLADSSLAEHAVHLVPHSIYRQVRNLWAACLACIMFAALSVLVLVLIPVVVFFLVSC